MDGDTPHRIGIIGAGRVARALGWAIAQGPGAPPLLWARSGDALAAAVAHIVRADAAASIAALLEDSDSIAIAVSDDALPAVVAALAGAWRGEPRFVFHLSGRSGAAPLEPLRAAGALTAAIHPAMTFTGDPAQEAARMASARFAITGSSPDAAAQARRIVERLGGVAVEIAEARRALYHAALCHASNHLVTLIADARQALVAAGVDDPGALLAPLVRAAADNSLDRGFDALSGPLLRGDADTIRGHVAALSAHCPDLLPAYRAMATATLDRLDRDPARSDDALRRALDSAASVP